MTEQSRAALEARRDAVRPSAGHVGHNTTPAAWVVVTVLIAAFIVGGIALIEWMMWLFWVSVGVVVLGVIGGWAAGIMEMVTEYGTGGLGGDPGEPRSAAREQPSR